MVYDRDTIGGIDGGRTALALCGFEPFGDITSIRHRLDAARAQLADLTKVVSEAGDYEEEFVKLWRHEMKIWEYAIEKGEALLACELLNPIHKR